MFSHFGVLTPLIVGHDRINSIGQVKLKPGQHLGVPLEQNWKQPLELLEVLLQVSGIFVIELKALNALILPVPMEPLEVFVIGSVLALIVDLT